MASAPQTAGTTPKAAKDCICCMAPAKLRCSGCQRANFCSKEHQKAAWGAHKFMCKGTDLDAFRQPPLLRQESDVYARTRRVNTAMPETALVGLEPYGRTGFLVDVLRSENASTDPLDYVWNVFQSTFATATPTRASLIVSLVRYNNYKNVSYPGRIEDETRRIFPSLKAFCKLSVLMCEPDPRFPAVIHLPDSTTNEAFRQAILAYFLLHTNERYGHIATDAEAQLLESAIARLGKIMEGLVMRKAEGAQRIYEIHMFLVKYVLVAFKGTWGRQKATGIAGLGEGAP
ncbi:hypothetical protein RQP46_003689 [Phenoliferia psychrophenolica]